MARSVRRVEVSQECAKNKEEGGSPTQTYCGLQLKYFVLLLLVVQNAMYTLLIRWSRGIRHDEYNISSVVVMVELVKILLSMLMIYLENPSRALSRYLELTQTARPMCVPALVYFVQKLLSFVALQYLDSAVYAILTQLKLLTTALFSVVFTKNKTKPSQMACSPLVVSRCVYDTFSCCRT